MGYSQSLIDILLIWKQNRDPAIYAILQNSNLNHKTVPFLTALSIASTDCIKLQWPFFTQDCQLPNLSLIGCICLVMTNFKTIDMTSSLLAGVH
ncbi:hypothetical protein AYI68_g4699 [Smittium mucronatum]|uniref:Uncharacterized protein n=1 Tax=Smittium mucronatum TaxID=133383 RepID=A0A1R0GWE4_9FUNG|nr:hypothetical protein AYI68_g4699 [Smittium mucronatum]